MSWYKIFYWLTVADNARDFFLAGVWIFTLISAISAITFFCTLFGDESPNTRRGAKHFLWWAAPFGCLFWLLLVFTPSKRDSLFIIAGGGALQYLTTDTLGRQIPTELSRFVIGQLRSMSKDVQIDLGIQTQRERLLEEAKLMTTTQLLERIQIDSVFRSVILTKQ